jgi:dipeptidyl aminopeptidase/acylaminoacyl peptidase
VANLYASHRFPRKPCLKLIALCFVFTWTRGIAVSEALESSHPLTLKTVLAIPFSSQLVAATQRERVAWIVERAGVDNIFVASAPSWMPTLITHYKNDDGQRLSSLRLSPDGNTILYVRGVEADGEGNAANPRHLTPAPKQEIHAIALDIRQTRVIGRLGCTYEGCEDLQISPDGHSVIWAAGGQIWIAPIIGHGIPRKLFDASGYNTEPRWSPDSRQIAYVSQRSGHAFIGVYRLNSRRLRYLAPSVDQDDLPRWSSDNKRIAFIRRPGLRDRRSIIPLYAVPWSVYVADLRSGTARQIWHSGTGLTDSFPDYTESISFHYASEGRIIFASEEDGFNHIYSVAEDGGRASCLTPGKDFEVQDVVLGPKQNTIIFSSNENDPDRRHIWIVPVNGGTATPITTGDGIEFSPVSTPANQVFYLGTKFNRPSAPYRLERRGQGRTLDRSISESTDDADFVRPQPVVFKARDGVTIHGQLFESDHSSRKRPAVIFVHGGPARQMLLGFHNLSYYHRAYAFNEYLANSGFIVLSVNYRSGTGYGRAFRESSDACWRGTVEYRDIVDAAHFLQSCIEVDPKKIGIMGSSFGGYLTAMALAHNSELFRAGIDLNGVHDWSLDEEIVGASSDPWTMPPDLEEARVLAFRSSPDAAIDSWRSPVLIIHGDKDENVDFRQSVDLVQRLREIGVEVNVLVFPGELHSFVSWKSWVDTYTTMDSFLRRTLRSTAGHSL